MKIQKIAAGLVAGVATTGALLASTSGVANALGTNYTPIGSTVNFVGSGVTFTAQPANQKLTCTQFDLGGTVTNSGVSRAYGTSGGSLTNLASAGCTNPIAGATTVTPTGAWDVVVTGDPTGTVFPARLGNVSASVVAASCSFNVGGSVDGTFDTATQKFTPGTSGLTVNSAPVGAICPTLDIFQGDAVEVAGSWTNAGPTLSVTSP